MYPLHFTMNSKICTFTSDGKPKEYCVECLLFPSKDQRDWNKWLEEQKSKVPKTWDDLVEQCGVKYYTAKITITTESCGNTSIEKSALALLKIRQLIEVGYGGNVTNEESYNKDLKYHIGYYFGDAPNNKKPMFVIYNGITNHNPLRFHTKNKQKNFLNIQRIFNFLKIIS